MARGTWKRIWNGLNVEFKVPAPVMVCPQTYFHGCWHWLAITEDGLLSVLSFNFAEEAFKLIGGPIVDEYTGLFEGSVFVLHDHLTAIHMFDNYDGLGDVVSVWVMKEYGVGDSWSKVYTIVPTASRDSCFLSRLAGIDSRFENGSISFKEVSCCCSELPKFLGGSCTYANQGGCLSQKRAHIEVDGSCDC